MFRNNCPATIEQLSHLSAIQPYGIILKLYIKFSLIVSSFIQFYFSFQLTQASIHRRINAKITHI